MDIYIINLPTQTKRREYMKNLMAKMNVEKYQFVTPYIVPDGPGLSKIKKTELSLYMTNLNLFKSILHKPSKYVLVFEDDVKPLIEPNKVMPKINSLIQQLSSDWDMFYLEYCQESCFLNKNITSGIAKASNPLCTAAIVYNMEKMQKIISLLELNHKMPIDRVYLKYILQNKLNVYVSTPPIFVQDVENFTTSINPYYIARSLYGYQSCNTHMIIHTLIFMMVIVLVLVLILKL
jgi:GR25 family glycosyltransferase involved in LPS biosynthesis